ncbi:MAG TPA: tetratricopeptide repeat protein [Acidobacteriaceae bacterium]|nr:tetratricopeptide repeat protein [Acidobacteriaceae bacterium]
MEAVNRGDAATAQPLLMELQARHPDSFEINESLGLIYAGEDNLPAALPLMTAAAAERPDSEVASVNLGVTCLKLGRKEDGARALEHAVRLNPQDARAQGALGQAWMEMGQPARAAGAFQQALTVGGDNGTLLYNAALAEFDAGEAARAAPLLARLPGVEKSAAAQSLYGDVEEKLGRYKEAGQHYINAARLDPTEANEYVLGVEFLRHWTFQPAAQEFAAASERFPESRRLRVGLGVAYFGDHNYKQAIAVFSALLAADPANVTYADLLGRSCGVLTEGSDPNCAPLVAFAREHPEQGTIATDAAISLLNRPGDSAQLAEAEQLLDAALRAVPNQPEAHYERGVLRQRESQWKESIPDLQTAIRLKPNYAAAHYRLALAWARTGARDKAREEIGLQQKYSAEENRERDERLSQMQTLLVTMR